MLRDRAPHPAPFSKARKHAENRMFTGFFAFLASSPFRPIPPHKMHESSPYHPQGFPRFSPLVENGRAHHSRPNHPQKPPNHPQKPPTLRQSRPVSDIVDGDKPTGAGVFALES